MKRFILTLILVPALTGNCFAVAVDRCVLVSGQIDCLTNSDDDTRVLVSKAKHESRNIARTLTEVRRENKLEELQRKQRVIREQYTKRLASLQPLVQVCDMNGCEIR